MFANDWAISATISGNFNLPEHERYDTNIDFYDGLSSIEISPQVDSENRKTGLYNLSLIFTINPPDDQVNFSSFVLDRAKDVVTWVTGRISISSGQESTLVGSVVATQSDNEDPKKFRRVSAGVGQALIPSIALNSGVFHQTNDKVLDRSIYWWSHAIRISDPAERLHALFGALDLLAGKLKPPTKRVSKCNKCGDIKNALPGPGEKMIFLLQTRGNLDLKLCEVIRDARNDLAHGNVKFNEATRRKYRGYAAHVQRVVREEIASRLGIAVPQVDEFPIDAFSSVLTIEYFVS